MATRACLGERVERRLHIEVTIAGLAAAEHIFPKTNNTVQESLDRVSQSPIMRRALEFDAGLRPTFRPSAAPQETGTPAPARTRNRKVRRRRNSFHTLIQFNSDMATGRCSVRAYRGRIDA